jgi:AAA domain
MSPEQFRDMSNRDLDSLVTKLDRRAKGGPGSFPFQLFGEFSTAANGKDWLIKGVMARGETSAWIAPPGGMKSALMGQAAICVAGGLDWHGKRNKGAAGVVYFALERADLVQRRLQAHQERMNLPSLPIAVVASTIDLMTTATVPMVVATIRAAEAEFGCPAGLLIFDTFAKLIAAGGGDEDKARDQGRVFSNIQRVKEQVHAHVAIVGHTGKDESRGARGSNAILGDADIMVTISGDLTRTATVTKANDMPEGPLFSFKSEMHEFGHDEDGDPITVNIVSDEIVLTQSATPRKQKLSPNEATMFGILYDAGSAGLTTADWNAKARELDIGTKRKATLHDLAKALARKGRVREYNGLWTVNQS